MHAKVVVWSSSFRKQSFSILIWIVVWCLSWPTSSWDIVLRFRQWDYFLALGDCEFKPVISGGGKPEPLIITWEHAETRNNVRGHHIIEWKSCQVNLIRANSPDRINFWISRRNNKWRTLFRHSIGKRKKSRHWLEHYRRHSVGYPEIWRHYSGHSLGHSVKRLGRTHLRRRHYFQILCETRKTLYFILLITFVDSQCKAPVLRHKFRVPSLKIQKFRVNLTWK